MRNIVFRGRTAYGEWVYGSLVSVPGDDGFAAIQFQVPFVSYEGSVMEDGEYHFRAETVDPATISEYTGLKDSFGTEIFEGDVLGWDFHDCTALYVVVWDTANARFGIRQQSGKFGSGILDQLKSASMDARCRVVGNVHDNPESL